MHILLTGCDGYCGWPIALRLAKEFPDQRIIAVDNGARREWVEECGAVSAIPICSMDERILAAQENGIRNISFVPGDLTDWEFVRGLYSLYRPHTVLHVAAQPSAPYSQINADHARYTLHNNSISTLNLLWGMREAGLCGDCHFIETTTTGVYGTPEFEIPEGYLDIEHKGGHDTLPTPAMAGSWYHMSKSNDVNYLWLSAKQWQTSITDLRTAIVYGTRTDETELDERLATRFDFDFYFGVVGNRFCAQAVAGYPITIYGKGLQRKPMISLQDTVTSSVNAVKHGGWEKGKLKVFNQCTGPTAIYDLAKAIRSAGKKVGVDVEIEHYSNPRQEKEEHLMEIDISGFMGLLGEQRDTVETGHEEIIETLMKYRDIMVMYKDRFLPDELA